MGEEPLKLLEVHTADFCREIEAYLCRKNDGHLIRVVGPSFDLVSHWATDGIPLKVALRGIDRYFERYYRKGPRRRPVRIDFCDADVREVFDEWRRAVGFAEQVVPTRGQSLPAHLERVVTRLTNARASGRLPPAFDTVIDQIAHELDLARRNVRGIRGEARHALLSRLAALDETLMHTARVALDEATLAVFKREATDDLAPFHETMAADAFRRAHEAAIDRLIRNRFGLPDVRYL